MCARAVLTNCMHILISKSACRKSLKQFDSSNWYYLSLFRRWLKKFGQGMEQITIRHPTTPSDRPYSVKENAICLQLPLVSVFRIENVRPSSNIYPSPIIFRNTGDMDSKLICTTKIGCNKVYCTCILHKFCWKLEYGSYGLIIKVKKICIAKLWFFLLIFEIPKWPKSCAFFYWKVVIESVDLLCPDLLPCQSYCTRGTLVKHDFIWQKQYIFPG